LVRYSGEGVVRAAVLVEFYEEVGYKHLIPAYAKYDWSGCNTAMWMHTFGFYVLHYFVYFA